MSGPHDLFFRFTFEHPERAAAELRAALAPRFEFLVGHEPARAATVDMLKSVVGAQRTEEMMQSLFSELSFEEWVKHGELKGEAKGRAEDVLKILAARGVQVDEKSRRRILCCMDLPTLDRWFDLALKATQLSDVLGPPAQ